MVPLAPEGRRGLALVAALFVAGGCIGAGRPNLRWPTASTTPPWELPADLLGQQALFRLHVEGPDGEGTLRLLLKLETADRYQLVVSDRLGRAVYGLDAANGAGRLIDHQNRRVCPVGPFLVLEGVPLEPIPLGAVPALLLGRVPERPVSEPSLSATEGEITFADARGRQWAVVLAEGRPVSWTLSEGGRPALWWRRTDRQNLLSDRERGAQLSWEETLREPLAAGALAPLQVPADYALGPCPFE